MSWPVCILSIINHYIGTCSLREHTVSIFGFFFFWSVLGESESWIQLNKIVSNDKSVPVLALCAE